MSDVYSRFDKITDNSDLQSRMEAELKTAGHVLKQEDGKVDWFAYDVFPCLGPVCVKCGQGFCQFCYRDGHEEIEQCTGESS